MIIFVGGLIGAGKSTVAKGLAERLGFLYFDLDEVKREVYDRDPENARLLEAGIPVGLQTRAQVYQEAIGRITPLLETHPNVVFDDTLHFRRFRHEMWDAMESLGHQAITVWVRADESVIKQRLTATPREGHVLKDPMPLLDQMMRDFEDFHHSLLMCPNNGALDDTLDDLISLLERIGVLLDHVKKA